MKNLLVKGVKRINEFNLIMNMPYDLGKRKKPDEHNCVVKSVQTDFPYSYEYVDNDEICSGEVVMGIQNICDICQSRSI